MAHEMLVGLHVVDDATYQRYRDAMRPILTAHGGEFRFDYVVSEVRKSATDHEVNRVFAIRFPDRARSEAFFANAEYRAARKRYFEPSVGGLTILAEYEHA